MENKITAYTNNEFGSVRTINRGGEPWFVAKDVATVLGYNNPRDAIGKHVDSEDKTDGVAICDSIGREQHPVIINESGLYSLILSSKLPTAKKFKRWITRDVIPSIRKSGGYIAGQESMSDTELMAKALMVAQKQIDMKNQRIAEMRPKEIFADAVCASKSSVLIGDLAKLLKQNGYDVGQNRLFEQLRNEGYLMRYGESKNLPTQKSMNLGLFEIKESTVTNADGSIRVTRTTKVTGKGQVYFVNKFCGKASEAD